MYFITRFFQKTLKKTFYEKRVQTSRLNIFLQLVEFISSFTISIVIFYGGFHFFENKVKGGGII
ncbi:6TM ABC transporter family protein [Blattabacterium punctulatus]|uniref:hypothetical protein n=1 Tax=Blattabacterium punctulatus TaxID=164514 RepID=UPI001F4226A2|nr:hypothetical protein [Blattabacterium punctulatus]